MPHVHYIAVFIQPRPLPVVFFGRYSAATQPS